MLIRYTVTSLVQCTKLRYSHNPELAGVLVLSEMFPYSLLYFPGAAKASIHHHSPLFALFSLLNLGNFMNQVKLQEVFKKANCYAHLGI